jgi:hypothetical protein
MNRILPEYWPVFIIGGHVPTFLKKDMRDREPKRGYMQAPGPAAVARRMGGLTSKGGGVHVDVGKPHYMSTDRWIHRLLLPPSVVVRPFLPFCLSKRINNAKIVE